MRPEYVNTVTAAYFLTALLKKIDKRVGHPDILSDGLIGLACGDGRLNAVREGKTFRIPLSEVEAKLGHPVTGEMLDKAAAAVERHRIVTRYRSRYGVWPSLETPVSAAGVIGRSEPLKFHEPEPEPPAVIAPTHQHTGGPLGTLKMRAGQAVAAIWPGVTPEERSMLTTLVIAAAIKQDDEFSQEDFDLVESLGAKLSGS